jgi:hypothetical protein
MEVKIRNARMSFMDLFTPKSINGGDPKFSGTFICTDDTKLIFTNGKGEKVTTGHEKMADICEHVLKEKFGKIPAKFKNWAYNKADGSTTREKFVNGDGNYWPGFDDDTWFVSANKRADKCKDGKMVVKDQLTENIEASDGKLFSGCYVNAILDVYAYKGDSGTIVTASLEGVQLKAKGEPLGMAPIDASDGFDVEEVDADEEFGAEDECF